MLLTHLTPDGVRRSRHQSLSLYGLPDVGASAVTLDALSEIVRLARSFVGVDGAAIGLIPDGRQVMVATTDSAFPSEVAEEHSVCAVVLEQRPISTIVIPDLSRDPRFADNPFVAVEGGVRGYASTPLIGHERVAVGTLCLWSFTPRSLTRDQCSLLDQLARAAVKILDDARRDRRTLHRFPERRIGAPSLPAA